VYEPVAWLAKGAQFAAFDLWPQGFVTVSVVMHVAVRCFAPEAAWVQADAFFRRAQACLMLLRATLLLVGTGGDAAFAACAAVASFGAHPLRVEVVAWASAQPYALAGAFSAAALLAHVTALRKEAGGRWRAAAVACYALAAFSKSAAMPLAAAHLALEATYGGAMSAHSLRMLLAVAAVAVAAAAGAFYGNASHVDVTPPAHNGGAGLWPRQRIAAAAASVADGAVRALTLRGVAVRYDLPPEVEAVDGRHLAASVPLLVLALAGIAALARQLPAWRRVLRGDAAPLEPSALPSCLTLALLALFPSSGVLRHGYDNAGADRYSYFAAMLLTLPVAQAIKAAMQVQHVGKSSHGWLCRAVVAAVAAAVVAAAFISARGCEAWRDPIAFGWAELAAAHTAAAQASAANDLGLRLHAAGRHAEALELLTGPAGLGAAAPTHLSMALTASACAAVLGQHARGLDALAPALREHGEREGALHINAAVLAAGACRAADALRHVRAAAALSKAAAAQTSLERRVSATLSCCVKGVVITWPVAAASGWGTLSRALLRALMDAGVAPMLLHAPTTTRHMLDAFSAAELRGLQAAHEELLRMIPVDGIGMADGCDPAACAVQELPLAVLHGLGNGLRGSDVVASGGGCVRLTGLVANVALLFFEDMSSLAPERLAYFTALVAGSSWTRDVLLAVQPAPRVVLALQGVDSAVFPVRQAQPQLDGAFRVFSGGKLEYRKGQDVVIAAFRRLLAACPGAVLLAAWHTDYPELAQALVQAGHVTKLPERLGEEDMLVWLAANGVPRTAVRLLGAMDAQALARAMVDCHVAIFPSRAESGTNLFAAQALASGVPSVLTGGTGHADLVDAFADLCWVMRRGAEMRDAARRGWVEPDVDEAVGMLLQAWEAAKRGLDAEVIAEAARRGAERMTWRGWFANASVAWGA
jgi:glycosyltransferase involved in cell wall biosynthesis